MAQPSFFRIAMPGNVKREAEKSNYVIRFYNVGASKMTKKKDGRAVGKM